MSERTKSKQPTEIADAELDKAQGGVGLLLPGVNRIAAAAERFETDTAQVQVDPGSTTMNIGSAS